MPNEAQIMVSLQSKSVLTVNQKEKCGLAWIQLKVGLWIGLDLKVQGEGPSPQNLLKVKYGWFGCLYASKIETLDGS